MAIDHSSQSTRLVQALEGALKARGFTTKLDVKLYDAAFELVAEDDSKLVFVSVRTNNTNWLDEFYGQQAALGTATGELDLGRKWRDVYLFEVTTDPVDSQAEVEMAEEIQANISTARKIIVQAGKVDPSNRIEVEEMLRAILSRPVVEGTYADVDVLASLRNRLVDGGLDPAIVDRLLDAFTRDGHDCVQIVMDTTTDETPDD